MSLDIPLPTAVPEDDPEQYIPLLLSAIEGFLLSRDVWEPSEYAEARQYMNQLMVYVVYVMGADIVKLPVGVTMAWHMAEPPDRWLICDGSGASKTGYPKLYALLGGKYGESTGFFGLPNLSGRSPFGADFSTELDETAGALTHTLTSSEMPSHSHAVTDPGHSHRVPKQSATVNAGVNTATPAARTDNPASPHITTDPASTGISIGSTGGGGAHNNLHPVLGVHFIIYAGA